MLEGLGRRPSRACEELSRLGDFLATFLFFKFEVGPGLGVEAGGRFGWFGGLEVRMGWIWRGFLEWLWKVWRLRVGWDWISGEL